MKTPPTTTQHQDDLALSSIAPHKLFPGRTTLYVVEVAKALGVTVQHVVALLEEYRDTGGKSGMLGLDISSGPMTEANPKGNTTSRAAWRVPVSGFDDYVRRAAGVESKPTNPTTTTK
jgi:hypothetical protein